MWALGEENTGPVEIEGQGNFPLGRAATLAMLRGRGARDFPNAYNTATKFKITLKFASGNIITVEDGPGNGIRLDGDKEQIWVSRNELKGRLVEAIAGDAGETERLAAEVAKLYGGPPATHMANFMASMRSRSNAHLRRLHPPPRGQRLPPLQHRHAGGAQTAVGSQERKFHRRRRSERAARPQTAETLSNRGLNQCFLDAKS